MQVDPIGTRDDQNLYAYVGNSPPNAVDPKGEVAFVLALPFVESVVVAGCAATPSCTQGVADVGRAIGDAVQDVADGIRDTIDATIVTTVVLTNIVFNEVAGDSDKPAPDAPTGLVGEQDDQAGERGNRHVSGPLAGEHGGTGDAETDFGKLTGGKSGPAPEGSGFPEGTRVGENGIAIRPATETSGPRIDIPAAGDKPHETLHYPPPEKKPWR